MRDEVQMFGRFGRDARRVIALAEDHARALWRPAVGPEHLLLALLAIDDGGVFHRAGLGFDDVRARLLGTGEPPADVSDSPGRHLPLRLREVFRFAFRHAAVLGDPEVTPLHLGLALVDDPPGEIAMVLRHVGVDAAAVREAILVELLDRDSAARSHETADGGAHNVVSLARPAPAVGEARAASAAP